MNDRFVKNSQYDIARAIKRNLRAELVDLLNVIDTSSFENDFYFPDSALVKKLNSHKTTFEQTVITPWVYMTTKTLTPSDLDAGFAYLEANNVPIPPRGE